MSELIPIKPLIEELARKSSEIDAVADQLQIPRDISLVVGDSHFLVDSVLPEITRYQRGHLQHAECAVRIAQALITGRRVGLKPRLFIPVFIAGSTLGPPALVPV